MEAEGTRELEKREKEVSSVDSSRKKESVSDSIGCGLQTLKRKRNIEMGSPQNNKKRSFTFLSAYWI